MYQGLGTGNKKGLCRTQPLVLFGSPTQTNPSTGEYISKFYEFGGYWGMRMERAKGYRSILSPISNTLIVIGFWQHQEVDGAVNVP
jgi:hypothetical protein